MKADDDYGIDEVGPGVWLSAKLTGFGSKGAPTAPGEQDMRAKFYDYTILPYEDADEAVAPKTAAAPAPVDDDEEGELPPAAAAPADRATKRNRLAALAGGAAAD